MHLHAQTSPFEADDRGFEKRATIFALFILTVGELRRSDRTLRLRTFSPSRSPPHYPERALRPFRDGMAA